MDRQGARYPYLPNVPILLLLAKINQGDAAEHADEAY
jgi:hypothetical protein